MTTQDTIAQDLKTAMLAGDTIRVSVLRSLKSAIMYAKVAPGVDKNTELGDDVVVGLFAKEAKKRQESADAYHQAGDSERAESELAEKRIIEKYLPAQLSEDEMRSLVEKVVTSLDTVSPQAMGRVVGQVKQTAGPGADGALIARLVRERLSQ